MTENKLRFYRNKAKLTQIQLVQEDRLVMEMREGSILVLYKKIYKVIYKKAINTSRGIKKEAP